MKTGSRHISNQITEGVIWKQLLFFFFPILFGTFFQQLYNTTDAVIVGKFVGKEALAAVGGCLLFKCNAVNDRIEHWIGIIAKILINVKIKRKENVLLLYRDIGCPENVTVIVFHHRDNFHCRKSGDRLFLDVKPFPCV